MTGLKPLIKKHLQLQTAFESTKMPGLKPLSICITLIKFDPKIYEGARAKATN